MRRKRSLTELKQYDPLFQVKNRRLNFFRLHRIKRTKEAQQRAEVLLLLRIVHHNFTSILFLFLRFHYDFIHKCLTASIATLRIHIIYIHIPLTVAPYCCCGCIRSCCDGRWCSTFSYPLNVHAEFREIF